MFPEYQLPDIFVVNFFFQVEKPNVGAIGVSKGGDIALSMSTFIPEVIAGVCINGSISNVQSRLNLHNSSIPGLDFNLGKIEVLYKYLINANMTSNTSKMHDVIS